MTSKERLEQRLAELEYSLDLWQRTPYLPKPTWCGSELDIKIKISVIKGILKERYGNGALK